MAIQIMYQLAELLRRRCRHPTLHRQSRKMTRRIRARFPEIYSKAARDSAKPDTMVQEVKLIETAQWWNLSPRRGGPTYTEAWRIFFFTH